MADADSETRFVFVTGGVVSSLGKGITAASLGRLLVARGLRVAMVKIDPYLNVDPGTMSPFQHGEVFVTEDGAETDLDLGNYERFTGRNTTRASSITSGIVYQAVIERERRGDYLGATVQVVPHVTDEIQRRLTTVAQVEGADVVLVEVGGTVGDIESLPFLEAIRQFRAQRPRHQTCVIHVTLVPYLGHAGELKTKPTQHSVQELRRIGMQPDLLVCRSQRALDSSVREKIALFASLPLDAVVSCHDVSSLYAVPQMLAAQDVDEFVLRHLNLPGPEADLTDWERMCERVAGAAGQVRIGLVGKYLSDSDAGASAPDAYMSLVQALEHAAAARGVELEPVWLPADELEGDADVAAQLADVDGVLVPGGFGARGVEGKVQAIGAARAGKVPFLGICLGMQSAVIEFARAAAGMPGAHSTEFASGTPYPVIDLLPEQKEAVGLGGTMRLGASAIRIHPGTLAHELYGEQVAYERHRHRYEVNNMLRRQIEDAGLVISGTSPDVRLVEIVELARSDHPFFLATQYHPEYKSRPLDPHPVFQGFVDAALRHAQLRRAIAEFADGEARVASEGDPAQGVMRTS